MLESLSGMLRGAVPMLITLLRASVRLVEVCVMTWSRREVDQTKTRNNSRKGEKEVMMRS
jgi:hypothetical protein